MYCIDAMVLLTLSQGNPLSEGDMFKNIKTPLLLMEGGVLPFQDLDVSLLKMFVWHGFLCQNGA